MDETVMVGGRNYHAITNDNGEVEEVRHEVLRWGRLFTRSLRSRTSGRDRVP
jgi:hypothetical protein